MASGDGKVELKAGHPPAVKAGGMRITQSNKPHEEPAEKPMTPEEVEEYGQAKSPPKSDLQMFVSGVPIKGNKDFPPEAVQSYHEKPQPTHQKSPIDHNRKHHVQQPKKM